jgi:hypothetical protein
LIVNGLFFLLIAKVAMLHHPSRSRSKKMCDKSNH